MSEDCETSIRAKTPISSLEYHSQNGNAIKLDNCSLIAGVVGTEQNYKARPFRGQ